MAKTKAPLGSFSAHGGLAKSLIYRVNQGINIVSGFYKPGTYRQRPASVSQLAQRALYSAAVVAWHALSSPEKLEYVTRALPLHLTGFNLFLRENMENPVVVSFRLLETGDLRLLETGDQLLLE